MGEGSGNNTASSINFIPKMGIDKLARGYRQVVETIYSPEFYYRRCLTFLKGYRQKTASKIQLSGIGAFFKGLWHMGIKNEEGFRRCFWKLLIRSLLINRRPSVRPYASSSWASISASPCAAYKHHLLTSLSAGGEQAPAGQSPFLLPGAESSSRTRKTDIPDPGYPSSDGQGLTP